MNVVSRGIRNAFRNIIRSFSIIFILGLSIGLSLAMLVAHQAVGNKINTVKASVGNTVSISPAGVRGFSGGGNPLTTEQLATVTSLPHVTAISKSLSDRLTSSNTNLVSAVDAGALGQRFARNSGQTFTGGASFGEVSSSSAAVVSFTPPVTVLGTTAPTNLASTQGGGTFNLTGGTVFSSTSNDNVALVGTTLATKNNLTVGSTFTAYSTTITVIGIFDSGNTFSNNQLIMPLASLQRLTAQAGDVTSATLTVDSVSNMTAVTTAAEKALGTAADVTNDALQAQNSIAPLENIQTISLYSLIGAVIAGSVIILLTMIMIVRERRREIGVIKAIGASNVKVMFQFMVEAMTLTFLGSVVGIVLGVVAGNPITNLLVTNSTSSATTTIAGGAIRTGGRGFGLIRSNIANVHAAIGWSIILDGLVAALIIALIGSALSSYFIAKIRPAEVMRTE